MDFAFLLRISSAVDGEPVFQLCAVERKGDYKEYNRAANRLNCIFRDIL